MELRRMLREANVGGEETAKLQRVSETLAFAERHLVYPDLHRIDSAGTDPVCTIGGRQLVMLASNDYLGLSRHPAGVAAMVGAAGAHGAGPGGTRILCGNVGILEDLDAEVARLVGCEDAITFPTGFMANLSLFRALLDPYFGVLPYRRGVATVFADAHNHATVLDGLALSKAVRVLYEHDDLADLERKLEDVNCKGPKMIVTEGVWSVDGRISALPAVVELAERHGAILMVDDAHGIGVLGERGGGTLQHFGLEGRADLVMGSFDKALGGMGGFLAGRRDVIRWLRMSAGAYVFSSAVPAVMAAAAIAAIGVCRDGKLLRRRLWRNAQFLRTALSGMGFRVLGDGSAPTAPVFIGDEQLSMRFQRRLFELGVYAPAFRLPAVPKGTARIRVAPMATHETAHLERAVEAFRRAGTELGLLG
jgi:8-amino-7-oxononanoate synthase